MLYPELDSVTGFSHHDISTLTPRIPYATRLPLPHISPELPPPHRHRLCPRATVRHRALLAPSCPLPHRVVYLALSIPPLSSMMAGTVSVLLADVFPAPRTVPAHSTCSFYIYLVNGMKGICWSHFPHISIEHLLHPLCRLFPCLLSKEVFPYKDLPRSTTRC